MRQFALTISQRSLRFLARESVSLLLQSVRCPLKKTAAWTNHTMSIPPLFTACRSARHSDLTKWPPSTVMILPVM